MSLGVFYGPTDREKRAHMHHRVRFLFTAVVAVLMVASLSPSASAQVAIAWNNCLGTSNASQTLQYACDGSLDGNYRKLALSFQVPQSLAKFTGVLTTVEFRSQAPATLPDYWRVISTGCRAGSVGFAAAASGVGDPVHCANAFAGYSFNFAIGHDPGIPQGLDYLRIETDISANVAFGDGIPLVAGQKYSAGTILIDPVGSDECAGCEQEICIQLVSAQVRYFVPFQGASLTLTGPNSTTFVTWQGLASGMCFGATPTRNQTWGAVKTLYR